MTMTNNAHFPQPYDVWRLAFYFEDKPDVAKERPVVVLDYNSETGQVLIAGAKVTTHAPRPDFPGEVQLKNWMQAGLQKPSVVRCSKLAQFPLSDFQGRIRYGRLTADDQIAVYLALRDMGYLAPKPDSWHTDFPPKSRSS